MRILVSNNEVDLSLYLNNIYRELAIIAKKWRLVGAEGIVIKHQNTGEFLSIPIKTDTQDQQPALVAPFDIFNEQFDLWILGIDDTHLQSRADSDAAIIVALLKKEQEINQLTEELIIYQDQLLALYELNHALAKVNKLENILHILAKNCQKITQCDHLFVVYKNNQTPLYAQEGVSNFTLEQIKAYYNSIQNLRGQNHLLSTDQDGSHLLLVPIDKNGRLIGMFGILNHDQPFGTPNIKLASAMAEQASIHIQRAVYYKERLQQERISAEMQLAQTVQMRLLPKVPDAVPKLEIWACCKPALEVGGDFYEFNHLDNLLYFSLGDVAGKGISAALLMAMSRKILHVLNEKSPSAILEKFNEHLYEDFSEVDSFVTLFTAIYDVDTHILHYANAGHSPVIYCPYKGAAIMLDADCPPIGVLPFCLATDHQLKMEVGDLFIVTSDGIPEAGHLMGTMLGYENLLGLINLYRYFRVNEIGRLLLKVANLHQLPNDDQTIVIIKRVE